MKIEMRPSGLLGANTYLVWDEVNRKGFIVDPGGFDEYMVSLIDKEAIDLEYIILTHGHGDHIGGVERYMEKFPSAKLIACEAEKDFLLDPAMNESLELCYKELRLTADIYVKDGDTLDVGDMKLKFIHTPGHTPGGMCIYVDGALFSGDTLFQYSIGRTDFPGGDFGQIIKSIKEKLFCLPDDTKVYPGHMGTSEIGKEKEFN
ncbi:MAG: MBL fold metallo-hydrolase, partial [Firmicutes bacterium]|nr:MBL fold metallo-hydrolase [Bacillota bacterium]